MDELQILELSLHIYKPRDINSSFLRFLPSRIIYDYAFFFFSVTSRILPKLLRASTPGPIKLLKTIPFNLLEVRDWAIYCHSSKVFLL